MQRSREFRRQLGFSGLLLLQLFTLSACEEDDAGGGDGMVKVTGFVVNVDRGIPAEGVVVSLLDHEDQYFSPMTGSDGMFFLEVPRGSPFLLVTNDWAGLDKDAVPGKEITEDWLTFINVEPMTPTIEKNMEALIHACPEPGSPRTWCDGEEGLGSAAVWKNFLENSDTAPLFTDAMDLTTKIVTFVQVGLPCKDCMALPGCEQCMNLPGCHIRDISVDFEEGGFGVPGYWSLEHTFNPEVDCPGVDVEGGNWAQDASVGPDIFVEGATASGPCISLMTTFANTDYAGDWVTMTLTDTNQERAIDFSVVSPLLIPVRDQATTFVVLGADDAALTTYTEALCAVGYLNCK